MSAIHIARLAVLAISGVSISVVALSLLAPSIGLAFSAIAVAALFDQWNETAWTLIRGTQRAYVEAVINGGTYAALVCVEFALLFSHVLTFALASVVALSFAVLRSYLACMFSGITLLIDPHEVLHKVSRHLRAAFPYMASDVLGLAYLRGDIVVLALFVSTQQVGEYVAAASFVGPLVQVASSMSMGALAVSASPGSNAQSTELMFPRFFMLSGLMSTAVLCASVAPITHVLYGPGTTHIAELTIMLSLFLPLRFLNFALSSLVLARGQAVRRLQIVLSSVVANIVLNLGMDRWAHASGAAWSTVLTEIFVSSLFLGSLRKPATFGAAKVVVGAVIAGSAVQLLSNAGISVRFAGLVTAAVLLVALVMGFHRKPQPEEIAAT